MRQHTDEDKLKLLRSWIHCDAVRHITWRGFGRKKKAAMDCNVFQALQG